MTSALLPRAALGERYREGRDKICSSGARSPGEGGQGTLPAASRGGWQETRLRSGVRCSPFPVAWEHVWPGVTPLLSRTGVRFKPSGMTFLPGGASPAAAFL